MVSSAVYFYWMKTNIESNEEFSILSNMYTGNETLFKNLNTSNPISGLLTLKTMLFL